MDVKERIVIGYYLVKNVTFADDQRLVETSKHRKESSIAVQRRVFVGGIVFLKPFLRITNRID